MSGARSILSTLFVGLIAPSVPALAAGDSCSMDVRSPWVEASGQPLASVLISVRKQACEAFHPDFQGMPAGTDPQCGEFGLDAGEKITDFAGALSVDCALLRFYQPLELRAEDPLVDLSVACNIEYTKKRLKNKLTGNENADAALDVRDARARACAQKAFDLPNPIPKDAVDPGEASPWSNFEKDMRLLESTQLSPVERERAEAALRSRKVRIEGWERPIRPGATVGALTAVMAQEARTSGITPKPGEPISWSQEFKECVGRRFMPLTSFSRTLSVLAMGMGMYHTPTGAESALYEWMKGQPDASIEPAELFRQAYRLNGGDIYRSILTIENLLSRAWLSKERDRLLQTRKLRPFTRTVGPAADTYGSWYHFFGTMLLGYASGAKKAVAISRIEGLGGLVLSREVEIQEGKIGRAGARTGGGLLKALKTDSWSRIPASQEAALLDFDTYINTGPGLEKRLERQFGE